MPYSIIVHIVGEAPIVGEVDELPKTTDVIVTVSNPRLRDGKELHYINNNVVRVIWPLAKVNFIEILEGADEEKIIGFVRE
jgi:hypothetical protein